MSIRVLIVDDERLVRAGFRMILLGEEGIQIAGEASNGREAIDEARRLKPDVILMDVRMPGVDGLAATREIVGARSAPTAGPRVIVLTTFDLDEFVFGALQAGATGFLLKDAPVAQLVAAIRAASTGASLLAPEATRRLVATFARRASNPDAATADLTVREREVLLLVAQGLSNREIATALAVAEDTVKTHVAHVLGKLGLRDRVQAVVFAYEHGLVGA